MTKSRSTSTRHFRQFHAIFANSGHFPAENGGLTP